MRTFPGCLLPLLTVLLLVACVGLAGCKPEDFCESQNDCIDADESGFDLLWECVDEQCEAQPCESSTDCAMLTHCQALPPVAEGRQAEQFCAEGCQRDPDCPPGTFCREGICEDKPCRNGHLDCELAEICEEGVCVSAGSPFCQDCNPGLNNFDNNGMPGLSCDTQFIGHPTCGTGNFCWNLPNGPSCGVPCVDNSECPGGFSCGQALYSAPSCPGEYISIGRFCVSDFCFQRL